MQRDKIILPFFFVSTDFLGDSEEGFFAALPNFMRGSLSELSSVLRSVTVTYRNIEPSIPQRNQKNTADIDDDIDTVTTCFLVVCAISSGWRVVYFLWFLSRCRDFQVYQRFVIWGDIWSYKRRRHKHNQFCTFCTQSLLCSELIVYFNGQHFGLSFICYPHNFCPLLI